ncbi:hypothetical protein GCM10009735_48700 [Actinomadura chokoriensis]
MARERARIALELHDTVAHHMSLTLVRAEATLRNVPDLPDAARHALEAMRDAARAALADTRRIVRMLRAGEAGVPQPGLDRLGELVGAACGGGLLVSSAILGVPRPLGACVDLAAFRIVQESLSNAVRYAPGACVSVEIRYGIDALTVSVEDDGARTASRSALGGGHGLAGMRERAGMLGGALRAGPRTGGGWTVIAELPYDEPGPGSPASDDGRTVVPIVSGGRAHGRDDSGRHDGSDTLRVVLAEGPTLLQDGLVRLLESYGAKVVEAVDNGPSLLRAVAEAREQFPDLPVLVLSEQVGQLPAWELPSGRGAIGHLLKDRVSDVGQFVDAVRRVAVGGTVPDPDVVAQSLSRHSREEPLQDLEACEREVLTLMAEGRSNAAIASAPRRPLALDARTARPGTGAMAARRPDPAAPPQEGAARRRTPAERQPGERADTARARPV